MSLYQRARDVLAAKANKALDAAEKPDEMLDLSYEQMLDQITKVRQGLVTIAASRKRTELDELLQSGVLEDVGGDTDDIQHELDEAGTAADVDSELAALKAELGAGSAPAELTSGSSPAADGSSESSSQAAGGPAAEAGS